MVAVQSLLTLKQTRKLLIRFTHLLFFFHRVTVTFNVNNSIPPNFEDEAEQGQQKSGEEEVSYNKNDGYGIKEMCLK